MFTNILPAEYSEVIEVVNIELTKDGNTEKVLKVSEDLATKKGDYEFSCIRLNKVNEDKSYVKLCQETVTKRIFAFVFNDSVAKDGVVAGSFKTLDLICPIVSFNDGI